MKKLLFTIALLITLSVATNAQNDGFFKWNGNDEDDIFRDVTTSGLVLPSTHGDIHNYNAPVGSGIAILTLLGVGYAIKCRRKNC